MAFEVFLRWVTRCRRLDALSLVLHHFLMDPGQVSLEDSLLMTLQGSMSRARTAQQNQYCWPRGWTRTPISQPLVGCSAAIVLMFWIMY
jgi:hypothetical protein